MGAHAMSEPQPAAPRKATGKRAEGVAATIEASAPPPVGLTVVMPQAGQRIVYHEGLGLAGCNPHVAKAMRDAAAAKRVDLVQRRLDDGLFAYEAVGRRMP